MSIEKKVLLNITTKNIRGETMKTAEIEITEDQMSNQVFIEYLLENLGRVTDTDITYDFKEKQLEYFNAHVNVIEYGNPDRVIRTLRFIVQANTAEEAKTHVYIEMDKILGKRNQEIHPVAFTKLDPDFARDILANDVSTLFDETDYFI